MDTDNSTFRQLETHRTVGFAVTLLSTLVMTFVCFFSEDHMQTATLGGLLSILVGLFVTHTHRCRKIEQQQNVLFRRLKIPFTLATEPGFFQHYDSFATSIVQLAEQPDAVLREFALMKLETIADEVRALAQGTVVFTATETWRTVYQKLLESLHVKVYYSVAWVKTGEYWNDPPGRQSMRLNYELVARGFRIERVLILPDELWAFDSPTPSPEIIPWIGEQIEHGIHVALVRESELVYEPDLLQDFGIYGDKAVGIQELDDRSRTVRFILHFDKASLRNAHDRWERLALYTTSYSETLDQVLS